MIKAGKFALFSAVLGILVQASMAVAAGTPQVQATVNENEVGLNDSINWSITVSSTDEMDIKEPNVSQLNGFELINSTEYQTVSSKLVDNGQGMKFEKTVSKTFTLVVAPKRLGKLTLPPVSVEVNGKKLQSQAITINVSEQAGRKHRRGGGVNPGGGLPGEEDESFPFDSEDEELFSQLLQRRGLNPRMQRGNPNVIPKYNNQVFFIHLDVDKKEVYEGEQVTAQWYIYTRGNILSLDRLKFPDLRGFWKEIIEEVPALQFTQEIINGVPYKKALLASHALFPIKSGTATIDEYKVKATVVDPGNMANIFGHGPAMPFTRSSDRMVIKVKPLPLDGRPKDFAGAVGQFDVKANVENTVYPVNQPFSLKIRFEGAGNAKLIDLPSLELPGGVELYETKSESRYFKNGKSMKEFEVLLIPRQEGEFKIPTISASFFDPVKKVYYSRTTEPLQIKVVPGTQQKLSSQRMGDEKAKEVNLNALPEPVLAVESSSAPMMMSWVWLVLYSMVGIGLSVKAKREFGWGQRKKSLVSQLEKRMKKVFTLLKNKDRRQAAIEMTNLGYFILGETSGLGGASVEIERLLQASSPSLRRELGTELKKQFEIFQALSFAPEEVLGPLKSETAVKDAVTDFHKVLKKAITLAEDKDGEDDDS